MAGWFKLYAKLVSKEAQRFFTYCSNIYSGIISAAFSLLVRYALWMALYATGNAQDSTLSETMTFFVVNALAFTWITGFDGEMIGSDIRSGDIAQRLTKPFSYHLQLVGISHGGALARMLVGALPQLFFATIFIGIKGPVSVEAFACFVVTALLGGVIYALIELIISYTAFWLTDSWYVSWFREALFTLFGGTMLPLWFYPGWLGAVCDVLPFRYAVYQPMAFYLGRVEVSGIAWSLLTQLAWIAVLLAAERAVWMTAQRKVTVQGG